MRVLVHGLASYAKGGIETFILEMAKYMNNDITFDYVFEEKNTLDEKYDVEGDSLFIEPKKHMFSNLKSWNKLLNMRKEIDQVVYFNWYSMAWLFPALMARMKGYRVIIHAHNNNLHNCGILQRILHIIGRNLQKKMNITRLTNSDLSARFFFGNKKAELIYNAIDTTKFTFDNNVRNQIRDELCIQDKHVYGFAGRIAYQKNPLFLIDIFRKIKEKDDKAILLVCGTGELLNEMKTKASNLGLDVLFIGNVKNIQDYYQAMDVFVLPSRFEGLGIVLIEAQTSGLPCVASENVIPKEAKITELLDFVPIEKGAEKWAEVCISKFNNSNQNRETFSTIVQNTQFEIRKEAPRLEKILIQWNN